MLMSMVHHSQNAWCFWKAKAIHGDMVSPIKNHGISLMSMGLLVPDETAMVWRGPMVQSALTQMLNNVVWGDLDVMVIDLPPGQVIFKFHWLSKLNYLVL